MKRAGPVAPMGERAPYGMPMGLACIMPRPIPGDPIPTPMDPMEPIDPMEPMEPMPPMPPIPSMGLGGTGLERRPLRPSDDGCGEMEAPNGLEEEGGAGDTPLLEMVLPGVTAMPGAGDEPGRGRQVQVLHGVCMSR